MERFLHDGAANRKAADDESAGVAMKIYLFLLLIAAIAAGSWRSEPDKAPEKAA
jgi:hypothetical protein